MDTKKRLYMRNMTKLNHCGGLRVAQFQHVNVVNGRAVFRFICLTCNRIVEREMTTDSFVKLKMSPMEMCKVFDQSEEVR